MSKRKVRVYPLGGIGNQLFILCAGIYFAKRIKSEVSLDFSRSPFAGTQHDGQMSELLDLSEFEIINQPRFLEKYRYLISRIAKKLKFSRATLAIFFGIFQSRVIGYDPDLEHFETPLTLEGYFQSYKYAEVARPHLVLSKTSRSEWLQNLIQESKEKGFISLHIRRGDYTQHGQIYGLLDSDFYDRAIAKIHSKYQHLPIWVFSDDIPEARKILSDIKEKTFVFIAPPPGVSSVESLILMTHAKVNIIANSTFSWWGAFLNEESSVIAPNPWFANLAQPENLLPPNWEQVKSSWS